jgi:uncharacterized protein (DUF934 family)
MRPTASLRIRVKRVDRESLALSQHPEFLELIGRSRPDFSDGRTISLGEMKRRIRPRPSPNKPTTRRARRG